MPILLILFIAIPIAEIATFIQVGDIIGLFPTIAVIILTAVVGSTLVRQQGLGVLSNFRKNMDSGEIPLEPAIHGLFLLISGLLLITPGFLTDALGFLLLVPQFRQKIGLTIWQKFKDSSHVHVYSENMSHEYHSSDTAPNDGPIIEGEIISENEKTKPNPDSKWAKIHNKKDK